MDNLELKQTPMDLESLSKTYLGTWYLYQSFHIYDNNNPEIHKCICLKDIYHLVLVLIRHEHIFPHTAENLYRCILLQGIQSLKDV